MGKEFLSRALADVFEKNFKKNKATSAYRLRHPSLPFNSPTILCLVLFSLTYRPEVWEKASEQLRTAKGKTFHRHNSRPSSQEKKLIKSRKLHLLTKQGPRHSVENTEQEYCLYPLQGILATEFLKL